MVLSLDFSKITKRGDILDFFDSIISAIEMVVSFFDSLLSSLLTLFSVLSGATLNIPVLLSYMPTFFFTLATASVAIYVVKLIIGRDN